MGSNPNPIREARNRLGLTQVGLGRRLGVADRTIKKWEAWRAIPCPEHVRRLRAVLDLSDVDVWKITHRASVKVAPLRKARIW